MSSSTWRPAAHPLPARPLPARELAAAEQRRQDRLTLLTLLAVLLTGLLYLWLVPSGAAGWLG